MTLSQIELMIREGTTYQAKMLCKVAAAENISMMGWSYLEKIRFSIHGDQ